uniref:Dedicator of cytokinesis C/D N-terminal domain-containing protein n=1 Tax=Plectus sambesii TaxID=2011161 RepID=A0A914V1M6_9BILA
RKTPISTPLDYETFLTKNLTILENDSQRDLLLFPRDDVTEQSVLAEERTFVPTVTDEHVKEAKWLLTQEALKLYSSPFRILTFNYAQFAGDFNRTNESDSDLPQLLYEIDLAAADEERDLVDCSNRQEVVKEGFLLLAPDAGLLDNFK